VILNVFDTLVAWTPPDFSKVEGRLATSWTISPDGRDFTFQLREGVKFHDDTPFDAEAVKFSLERTKASNPFTQASFGLIREIAVLSPTSLRISLSEPYPAFLSILAQPQSAIVSPTAVRKFGDQFGANPVGTGPFIFRSRQADTNIVLDANPNCFRGAPKLARLIYRIIPDASTRRLEIENGGVDVVQQAGQLAAIPSETVQALKSNPNITILEAPSQIIRQLEFNNSKTDGPLSDIRVRRAIAHAIDYDGLLQGVFGNTADRVYGPLTSNSWAFRRSRRQARLDHRAALYVPGRALGRGRNLYPGQSGGCRDQYPHPADGISGLAGAPYQRTIRCRVGRAPALVQRSGCPYHHQLALVARQFSHDLPVPEG
jgi:peptide/nickel transport system substrate-binding protein